MKVIRRHLATSVARALRSSRIVNVVGPRQAGKTTLVRDLIEHGRYITLDDPATRESLEADPYEQLVLLQEQARKAKLPIVLDEVQRLPEITLALKRIVDSDPRPGQFVLTGSSDIFSSGKAYDSLAGRVMTLTLRPLSISEAKGNEPCTLLDSLSETIANRRSQLSQPVPCQRKETIDLILRGGFPEIRKLAESERAQRYVSYLDSIVERDVAPIAEVRKPDTLRRLIDQLAVRTAEELNVSALCSLVGSRRQTIEEYLEILTRLGIVHRLGAWTSSGARREISSPKLHFLDTGCATALRGEDSSSFGIGADPAAIGHLLESLVFVELEKSLPFARKRWRLYHWRWPPHEIDIVAEAPGRTLVLFEVKASSKVSADDFRHINWFSSGGPGKGYRTIGVVVYLGDQILSFGAGRIAIPLSLLWS